MEIISDIFSYFREPEGAEPCAQVLPKYQAVDRWSVRGEEIGVIASDCRVKKGTVRQWAYKRSRNHLLYPRVGRPGVLDRRSLLALDQWKWDNSAGYTDAELRAKVEFEYDKSYRRKHPDLAAEQLDQPFEMNSRTARLYVAKHKYT